MVTTHRSDLVEQLEKALTDEAYDGGNGALSEVQFAKLVRKLAETADGVVRELAIACELPHLSSLSHLGPDRDDGAGDEDRHLDVPEDEVAPVLAAGVVVHCYSGVSGSGVEPFAGYPAAHDEEVSDV